ncbi:MAG: RluA family pseudouridine synthase [Clostridia bacterium]|nr:RluA family pseudouridine synthase [Clostridia bacterium]
MKAGNFLRHKGISHTLLVMIKRQGMLLCNDRPVYSNVPVHTGDTVSVEVAEEHTSTTIAPEAGDLEILYEDEDLLAINKDAMIPVHPSRAHVYGTLAGRVMAYYAGQDFTFRAVNRLDLGTSGIVLIAKNPLSANWFHERGEIIKEYTALAQGVFPRDAVIDLPISRAAPEEMLRVVSPAGEQALTLAHREALRDGFSVVSFRLFTGRTHQIRVHASHLGYPLLGDPLYNPDGLSLGLARQALHAKRVTLTLPYSTNRIVIQASLPDDMADILRSV